MFSLEQCINISLSRQSNCVHVLSGTVYKLIIDNYIKTIILLYMFSLEQCIKMLYYLNKILNTVCMSSLEQCAN